MKLAAIPPNAQLKVEEIAAALRAAAPAALQPYLVPADPRKPSLVYHCIATAVQTAHLRGEVVEVPGRSKTVTRPVRFFFSVPKGAPRLDPVEVPGVIEYRWTKLGKPPFTRDGWQLVREVYLQADGSYTPDPPTREYEWNGRVRTAVGERLDGHYRATVPCNAICTGSTGKRCDCSCGGVNHGTGRVDYTWVETRAANYRKKLKAFQEEANVPAPVSGLDAAHEAVYRLFVDAPTLNMREGAPFAFGPRALLALFPKQQTLTRGVVTTPPAGISGSAAWRSPTQARRLVEKLLADGVIEVAEERGGHPYAYRLRQARPAPKPAAGPFFYFATARPYYGVPAGGRVVDAGQGVSRVAQGAAGRVSYLDLVAFDAKPDDEEALAAALMPVAADGGPAFASLAKWADALDAAAASPAQPPVLRVHVGDVVDRVTLTINGKRWTWVWGTGLNGGRPYTEEAPLDETKSERRVALQTASAARDAEYDKPKASKVTPTESEIHGAAIAAVEKRGRRWIPFQVRGRTYEGFYDDTYDGALSRIVVRGEVRPGEEGTFRWSARRGGYTAAPPPEEPEVRPVEVSAEALANDVEIAKWIETAPLSQLRTVVPETVGPRAREALARRLPKSNPAEPIDNPTRRYVYAVDLRPEARSYRRAAYRNPHARAGTPTVYVGQTGKEPEERFDDHMREGPIASDVVRRFGVRLRTERWGPFESVEAAEAEEKRVAEMLKRRGWFVLGAGKGHS